MQEEIEDNMRHACAYSYFTQSKNRKGQAHINQLIVFSETYCQVNIYWITAHITEGRMVSNLWDRNNARGDNVPFVERDIKDKSWMQLWFLFERSPSANQELNAK